MKPVIAVLAVITCAFALPAAAQFDTGALYVGGSVGQSQFKQGCTRLPSGVSCDEKDTAWRILGGDRKRVVLGEGVELGGCRIIKKKNPEQRRETQGHGQG